jgi:signal transduction histidine kinase
MIPRFLLGFFLLATVALTVTAQLPLDEQNYVRRLESSTKGGLTDSIKAMANFELSKYWALTDTVKSAVYLVQGQELAKKHSNLQILNLYYKAFLLSRNNLDAAEKLYLRTERLLAAVPGKGTDLFRAKIWYELGIIKIKKDTYNLAADIILNKSIPLAGAAGNPSFIGTNYLLLANIFKNAGQHDKAETYCLKAIKIFKENQKDTGELIDAFQTLAENYTLSGRNQQGRAILDKAWQLLRPYPESQRLLDYYAAECLYFIVANQFEKALLSIDKGLVLSKKLKVSYKEDRLLLQKFYASYYNKDFEEAKNILRYLLKQDMMMALSVNRLQLYHGMAVSYEGLGKMDFAYTWMKRYSNLSDSVSESKLKNEVNALEIKYKNAEKQQEINKLKADNIQAAMAVKNNRLISWLLGTVSLFLTVVALLLYLYYRNNKKLLVHKELSYRQHLNEMQQQQQLQYSQAMLEGEEQERRRLARDLHDGLGGMLAGAKINLSGQLESPVSELQKANLQKVIGQLDNSVTELRRIAHNMMPVNLLNFGLKTALKDLCETFITPATHIDFHAFEMESPIPEQTQINIYRIVQEMLANAVRHANATNILLQCSRNGRIFLITQEDNGKGFDVNSVHLEAGIGLSNIRNRVGFLKGKMDIESAADKGTIINIELHIDG